MIDTALKNGYLLLVDDEGQLLTDLADFLREQGIKVDTANSGRKAMAALQENAYTLMVTDIRMPDVSGMELLRHTKKNHPEVAVILITGYASTGSAIEALHLGAYDYLEKPFEMLELFQTIVNALEHAELKRKNVSLIDELQAHQRSLERLVESKTSETASMRSKLAHFEAQQVQIENLIDVLHNTIDPIRDHAEECRQEGKGYPGVVNRLIRTCLRRSRVLSETLMTLEEFMHTNLSVPPVSKTPAQTPNLQYVPEPVEEISDSDVENLYAQLYTCTEHFISVTQQNANPNIEPIFALFKHIVSHPQITNELYRRAIQTSEADDDWSFVPLLVLHSIKVAIYALKLGEGFNYTQDQLIELGVAALLHDLGMLTMPADAFSKANLTKQERALLHQHPQQTQNMLKSLGLGYEWLANVVYQEHEREDGSGYPQKLPGDQIHPYAKLIGLADTYAGLTRARPDRPGLLPFEAVKEITHNQKSRFNGALLRVLLNKLSTFPIGSMVRLNSGTVGKVIDTDEAYPLRPSIQIVTNPQGISVQDKRIIHLREHPVLYITDVVYQKNRSLPQHVFRENQTSHLQKKMVPNTHYESSKTHRSPGLRTAEKK